ncbi:NAD-dependent deacetylase sirtuin-2 [Pholiota conissans]|uniref:NAD-dependent deacetylase sirtuin-2 n=1 Tax=Pholiota conissans TaxID=109636 RepID=A0A9P6D7K4_9AGAR|nr:NAD-dependent deacetylase sirtuin-2 [Pholiota conissans]
MNFRRQTRSNKPKVLSANDLPALVEFMKSDKCKNVILMLGAGVSTSAGIPDFRSPETGLYSNLARLNLPHPEAVFEINFFRRNPVPFYTLAHELYPGKFRPTITHSFIRLLAEKGLLHTCFTQNIDTLERRAGVPEEKIIEAHGSFATQRCIYCHEEYDDEKMREHILSKKIAKCDSCGGYVKPDIVFFGEALPDNFIGAVPNLRYADLLIVMGTSLTVQPFASLADRVDYSCPRVLINLDLVGSFGSRSDDVVLLGKCDDVVKKISKELGWEDELIRLWNETEATVLSDTAHIKPTDLPVLPKEAPEESETLKEIEKQLEKLELDGTGLKDAPAPPATSSTPANMPSADTKPLTTDVTSTPVPKETLKTDGTKVPISAPEPSEDQVNKSEQRAETTTENKL